MVKLDIGSGGKSSDSSFIGVDLYTDADIKAPMWQIPVDDQSVDVIFSSQALEHVAKSDIARTLTEWYRILKHRGKIQVIVPDLKAAVEDWLNTRHDRDSFYLDVIYGGQKHEGDFHKTGFVSTTLGKYMVEAGFATHKVYQIGERGKEQISIVYEGWKP